MHIGFVTCHFPPDSIGGAQMQSLRLCKALSEKYDVTVFTRSYTRIGQQSKVREGRYTLQRRRTLKLPVLKSIVDLVMVLFQMRSYKKEIRMYVSFQIQLASLMVVFAKWLYGTEAIVSPRGFEDFDFKWYKKWFQKFIYRNADLILIQSDNIKGTFIAGLQSHFSFKQQERIKGKIRIFPNGIHVPPRTPGKLSRRKNQIVFVGRLEPIKGVVNLLKAFRSCDQDTHLLIIGDGSQRKHLELCAAGLNVSFLGACSAAEINRHLNDSRVLVLPSLSENFPNVILEAFCAGVPVIGSSVGAIPELIDHGRNGYLIPPADPNVLADKINLILQNENTLDEMGRKSYQDVGPYDWSNLVNQMKLIIGAN